jgi:hypothetical protein
VGLLRVPQRVHVAVLSKFVFAVAGCALAVPAVSADQNVIFGAMLVFEIW